MNGCTKKLHSTIATLSIATPNGVYQEATLHDCYILVCYTFARSGANRLNTKIFLDIGSTDSFIDQNCQRSNESKMLRIQVRKNCGAKQRDSSRERKLV